MARFEVFVPASGPDGINMTLRVTADTWMAALKVGLRKIGNEAGLPPNVLCDIQDDGSIHVTDPRQGRVFRIIQLPEVSDPGALANLPTPSWMAAPSDPPRAEAAQHAAEEAAAEKAAHESAEKERLAEERAAVERELAERAAAEKAAAEERAQRARAAVEKAAAEARLANESSARAAALALEEKLARERKEAEIAAAETAVVERSAVQRAAQSRLAAARAAQEKLSADRVAAERAATARLHARPPLPVKIVEVDQPKDPPPAKIGRPPPAPAQGPAVEEVLVELFERTPAMFAKRGEEALYFLLDLAMEKVPCESGTFYVADLNRRDLGFGAVRGPKSKELLAMHLRVPMGKGFVGFCAQEGVGVAISDVQNDKRFFHEISERLGYETKSMITTPVIHEGRTLGALQLINKKGSTSFTAAELSVLHYLAHQAALYLEAQG